MAGSPHFAPPGGWRPLLAMVAHFHVWEFSRLAQVIEDPAWVEAWRRQRVASFAGGTYYQTERGGLRLCPGTPPASCTSAC